MRALQLIPILLSVAICFGEEVFYVYPASIERLGRSQNLERVDIVHPYEEQVEVMTPVPLEEYYRTTDISETTTKEVDLTTTEAPEDDTTTTIPTTLPPVEISTTVTTEIPTTTSTTTPVPTTTTDAIETSSTERGQKSILSWKERMLERFQKRPKFPSKKIKRKFVIAQNYGKSRYPSKNYKTTTTTEVPSSSEATKVTRKAFNRAKYSLKRRTTTTTTEIPTTRSEALTSTTTSEPSYREKYGRGRARFIKLRRVPTQS